MRFHLVIRSFVIILLLQSYTGISKANESSAVNAEAALYIGLGLGLIHQAGRYREEYRDFYLFVSAYQAYAAPPRPIKNCLVGLTLALSGINHYYSQNPDISDNEVGNANILAAGLGYVAISQFDYCKQKQDETFTFQPVITQRFVDARDISNETFSLKKILGLLTVISVLVFGGLYLIPSSWFVYFLGEQWEGIGTIIKILCGWPMESG